MIELTLKEDDFCRTRAWSLNYNARVCPIALAVWTLAGAEPVVDFARSIDRAFH